MRRIAALSLVVFFLGELVGLSAEDPGSDHPRPCSITQSLDGDGWLLATDPANVGREQNWATHPQPDAKPTRVPWIIQDAFPGYHGVAWYWRDFKVPENPHKDGRYLLRFWAVDYKADVWLNGIPVGTHEGGETPFTLDVTEAIRSSTDNYLAVRVLNPTHEPIDGIVLNETPHRNKVIPYTAGSSYNHGGIVDSVELLVTPAVRITDVFLRPDATAEKIGVQVQLENCRPDRVETRIELAVAAESDGRTSSIFSISRMARPGESVVNVDLAVANPRLWNLNEPNLYRVCIRAYENGSHSIDEQSARCGFRDFRFENGYFRLNGKRLFLKCSHTGNHCPVGLQLPPDPDMLRRDLLNVKVMGFNAIRFIAGMATRYQLDLCDEIGLLVYEEHFGSWRLAGSPQMASRFDRGLSEMIQRDRNHPSVVIWGLLNETQDGPVFRHAAASLPLVRSLDDSRMVMLNSGRWDLHGQRSLAGIDIWRTAADPDPNVTRNRNPRPLSALGITWQAGQLALHPGPEGQYSVVRWTSPVAGPCSINAAFTGIAQSATTDVHVLHNGRSLHDQRINIPDRANESEYAGKAAVAKGDTVDFVVGFGNGHYGGDTTALTARIEMADGKSFDAAAEFSVKTNPNGPWSYGLLAAGLNPDATSFTPYPHGETQGSGEALGSLSNPGSTEWEDVLDDEHPYQHVPHTASVINTLRTFGGGKNPMFISEYGVGSGVDLWRVARHYERIGKENVEDAQFYRDKLDRFLADWERWKMDECFATPQEFFAQSIRRMADERLYGLNALRANPSLVAHCLTGTVDQGMSGEGLFTTFRELKPGTTDALFEALAPLRLCLFAGPTNVYRGAAVRLEAVLADEDALPPGDYPVRLLVVGPDGARPMDRVVTVTVPENTVQQERPFASPFFSEPLTIDGPPGRYRFLATMERGGAPTGGEAVFFVGDEAAMPAVDSEVVLWGNDPELETWLGDHGIRTRRFSSDVSSQRELILACGTPPEDGPALWRRLVERTYRGASVVFLSPSVFRRGDDPTGWLPLAGKGKLIPLMGWLYHKDEWAKNHPIFTDMPSGGMMPYEFYREILPDLVFSDVETPEQAIAGANNVSFDYSAGLMLAECRLGEGRFLLNTLLVRENLGKNPVADQLLRNMLCHAAPEAAQPAAELPADFEQQLQQIDLARGATKK